MAVLFKKGDGTRRLSMDKLQVAGTMEAILTTFGGERERIPPLSLSLSWQLQDGCGGGVVCGAESRERILKAVRDSRA